MESIIRVLTIHLFMFSPEKDLSRKIIELLGKDGMSISSLDKELSRQGIKDHRLVLTGYLRAMTDLGYLRMRDVPPAKIYVPAKRLPDNIYDAVTAGARAYSGIDTDEVILYCLNRLFRRMRNEQLAVRFNSHGQVPVRKKLGYSAPLPDVALSKGVVACGVNLAVVCKRGCVKIARYYFPHIFPALGIALPLAVVTVRGYGTVILNHRKMCVAHGKQPDFQNLLSALGEKKLVFFFFTEPKI